MHCRHVYTNRLTGTRRAWDSWFSCCSGYFEGAADVSLSHCGQTEMCNWRGNTWKQSVKMLEYKFFFCTSVKECGERCEQVSNFSKSVKNQTQGHLVARRKYCQLCVLASLILMPTHQCSGSRCVGHRTQQRLVAAKLSLKWKYNLNKQVCSFQRRYFAEAQKPQKWLIIIISHHKSTNVKKCTVKTLNKPVRFNYHTR